MEETTTHGTAAVITPDGLQALINALPAEGYTVLGPAVRDGAIVYDRVATIRDLPAGWTDRQDVGRYRLERRDDGALFGYVVGPHSWKRVLHPPVETLWTARKTNDGFTVAASDGASPRYAFLGMRACELHAMAIEDRVFEGGPFRNEPYSRRRGEAFFVAVNCGQAGDTCFCASMRTGPKADGGFDLALTELIGDGRHEFLVETASEAGAEVLRALPHRPAANSDIAAAGVAVARAADNMGRRLETEGLKELLQGNLEHPRWDQVAERCPTCFCAGVEDHTDLAGTTAERVRVWDSCFHMAFSYIHGGSVRKSARSRYRQWMTHKLANWIDQFGTSGCVGCGRCITWYPVGIDITEEAAAIRSDVEAAAAKAIERELPKGEQQPKGEPHGNA